MVSGASGPVGQGRNPVLRGPPPIRGRMVINTSHGPSRTAAMDVFLLSAARTPIGKFLGELADVPAPRLGAAALAEALKRANVAPGQVDEVIFGNVVQAGTTFPKITSSTWPGATFARLSASARAAAPSRGAGTSANSPRNLPIGVRAADRRKTSMAAVREGP